VGDAQVTFRLFFLSVLLLLVPALSAQADDEPNTAQPWGVVRVIAESAEVRTGPGFSYRAIHVAPRGETMTAVARANRDYWFQVHLPDGTYGWILGDQVLALNVDPTVQAQPGFFARVADAIFSPPPLENADVGLAFSAGFMGGEAAVIFRPSVMLAPHLSIEGYIGESVDEQVDVVYYGSSANLIVWPKSPVTLFFALGGGGTLARPKVDQYAGDAANLATASAGGGLLIFFKKRITLRLDFRNYTLFDANNVQELQEYTGGLAIYF